MSHLTSKAEIYQRCIRGKKEQKHSVKREGGEITEGRDLALARRGTRHRCEMRRGSPVELLINWGLAGFEADGQIDGEPEGEFIKLW